MLNREHDRRMLSIQMRLIQGGAGVWSAMMEAAEWFSNEDYAEVIEERAQVQGACGFPPCGQRNRLAGGKSIAAKSQSKLKLFCSRTCFDYSNIYSRACISAEASYSRSKGFRAERRDMFGVFQDSLRESEAPKTSWVSFDSHKVQNTSVDSVRPFRDEEAAMDRAVFDLFFAKRGEGYARAARIMFDLVEKHRYLANFARRFANGGTPLMAVASRGDGRAVDALVRRYGANVDARAADGKTAADIAREKKHLALAQWLDRVSNLRKAKNGAGAATAARIQSKDGAIIRDVAETFTVHERLRASVPSSTTSGNPTVVTTSTPTPKTAKARMLRQIVEWTRDATRKYVAASSAGDDAVRLPQIESEVMRERAAIVFQRFNVALEAVYKILRTESSPSSARYKLENLVSTFQFRRPVDNLRPAQWELVAIACLSALGVATPPSVDAPAYAKIFERAGVEKSEARGLIGELERALAG